MVLNILNFTFTIEVIKTDKNVIADYLSRQCYSDWERKYNGRDNQSHNYTLYKSGQYGQLNTKAKD